ncbi:hypothetical protein LMG26686_00559 [Achromobacter mucicolens]|nr:hypothetical protein LMG26686_00559 [Achromobacter mucicolens]
MVDVLTDEGKGRMALSSSIKDLLLTQKAAKAYTELGLRNLLHELQEYGGHSIVNLFRSEPLPYEDLLTDVHKKLNGKNSDKKSAWDKEQEIVLSLFGENWECVEDHDRWSRCTETRVVNGLFNMQENLNVDANGRVFALSAAASAAVFAAMRLSPPIAVASTLGLAVQSISEAYRITIPFVAQIARIKMLAHNADK